MGVVAQCLTLCRSRGPRKREDRARKVSPAASSGRLHQCQAMICQLDGSRQNRGDGSVFGSKTLAYPV